MPLTKPDTRDAEDEHESREALHELKVLYENSEREMLAVREATPVFQGGIAALHGRMWQGETFIESLLVTSPEGFPALITAAQLLEIDGATVKLSWHRDRCGCIDGATLMVQSVAA